MAAYAAHTTNQNTHLTAQKKQEPLKKNTYLSENGGLGVREKSQENGPKACCDSVKNSTQTYIVLYLRHKGQGSK